LYLVDYNYLSSRSHEGYIGNLSGELTIYGLENLPSELKIHSDVKHSHDYVVDQRSFQYFVIHKENNLSLPLLSLELVGCILHINRKSTTTYYPSHQDYLSSSI
jgi:hypothetical protein